MSCVGVGMLVRFRCSDVPEPRRVFLWEFALSHASTDTNVPSIAPVPQGFSPEPNTISDWQAVRQAVGANESHLRVRTFKWMATLPAHVRPMAAGRQYARIVNRIADLWSHCESTRLYFQGLLIDRRPGREGFPAAVRHELEVLQDYYFEHLSGLPAILWNAVPVAEPKIPNKVFAPYVHKTEIDILSL
jgi:hypothetical protein